MQTEQTKIRQLSRFTLFGFGDVLYLVLRTFVDMASNFLVLSSYVKVDLYNYILYLYHYSYLVEPSMNIQDGKN